MDKVDVLAGHQGSAMYLFQSLCTAALLKPDILFAILANREYRVLKHNLDTYRSRFDASSNDPYPRMGLSPMLDFTALAHGMGVPSQRSEDPSALQAAMRAGFAAGGLQLLEVVVSGKQ